jgi:hypothetical protein
MNSFDTPRRPGVPVGVATPKRRIVRTTLCTRKLLNGHVRTLALLTDERGAVLCSGVNDGKEYYGKVYIFPPYAQKVLDACAHAQGGPDGLINFGRLSTTDAAVTIEILSQVAGDFRAVILERSRPNGERIGSNLTFFGTELDALAKGCELLLSATQPTEDV